MKISNTTLKVASATLISTLVLTAPWIIVRANVANMTAESIPDTPPSLITPHFVVGYPLIGIVVVLIALLLIFAYYGAKRPKSRN